MSTICPVCNNIKNVTPCCSCGNTMENKGPLSDYDGPYSPYFNTSFEDFVCTHLFSCPVCGTDKRLDIPLQQT